MVTKQITGLLIDACKKWTGKGPRNIRVYNTDNVLIVDIKGTLTVLEQSLLQCGIENKELIAIIRNKLIQKELPELSRELGRITGEPELIVKSFSFDIDYENDRKILIFMLNLPIQCIQEEVSEPRC